MMLSTLLMFVPRHVEFLFFIIVAVGFFGIYVPWNERKKRKNRKENSPAAKLERLEALKEEGLLSEEEFEERRREILQEPQGGGVPAAPARSRAAPALKK